MMDYDLAPVVISQKWLENILSKSISNGLGAFRDDAIHTVYQAMARAYPRPLAQAYLPARGEYVQPRTLPHEVHCGYIFESGDLIYRCKYIHSVHG